MHALALSLALLAASSSQQADEKEIKTLAEAINSASNNADAKAMSNCFAADATHVDAAGGYAKGRADIEKLLQKTIDSGAMKNLKTTITVDHITFLKPDVAMVDCSHEVLNTTITDGKSQLVGRVGVSVVVLKEKGKWLIGAARAHVIPLAPPT